MTQVHKVRCDRLRQVTRPFFGWVTLEDIRYVRTVSDYVQPWNRPGNRPDTKPEVLRQWDLGRVRFFVEELRHGRKLDPIHIETTVHGSISSPAIWGNPIIEDGHHRAAAAVALGEQYIRVSFGGLISQRDWLTGKRRRVDDSMCLTMFASE